MKIGMLLAYIACFVTLPSLVGIAQQKCIICNGSGVCQTSKCGGRGKYYSASLLRTVQCAECAGSGNCKKCKGSDKDVIPHENASRNLPAPQSVTAAKTDPENVHQKRDEAYWRRRSHELAKPLIRKFFPPRAGISISITKRVGGSETGLLRALTSNAVNVGGKTYARNQLSKDTCARLFPGDWALAQVEKQVSSERQAYAQAENVKTAKRQAERSRQTLVLASALLEAKRNKTYEAAIRGLSAAIKSCPDAHNVGDAELYLNQLSRAHQQALEKSAQKKQEEQNSRLAKQHVDKIPSVINGLLREQARGRVGYSYWADSQFASQLFAPADWEIMETRVFGNIATATVRIDSSTKGGIRIRVLWRFFLKFDREWKVSLISEL
jgi:hypothetical protein